MRVLVIDIGGNNVKVAMPGHEAVVKIPSGNQLIPRDMLTAVRRATAGWDFDVVSVGYPGPVVNGRPSEEPVNLGPGWVGFDFEAAFGKPVRFVNDAAMQALGSYEGGRMLFLGLGTGLGTALIVDGVVVPLEAGHLPYRKGRSFEDHVGRCGLERYGRRRWREFVADVTARLKHALQADYVVIGGGNVKELRQPPDGARFGTNQHAIVGGLRLWEPPAWAYAAVHPVEPAKTVRRRRPAPAVVAAPQRRSVTRVASRRRLLEK